MAACANALGLHDLAEDEALRTNAGRVKRSGTALSGCGSTCEGGERAVLDRSTSGSEGTVRGSSETWPKFSRAWKRTLERGSVRCRQREISPPKLDEHGESIRTRLAHLSVIPGVAHLSVITDTSR